jgi:ankyrin repeat protein
MNNLNFNRELYKFKNIPEDDNTDNTENDENNLSISKLLLDSFTDKRPDIASYIIKKYPNIIINCEKDSYERSLLHYLVIYSNYKCIESFLIDLFKNKSVNINNNINIQDKFGNTPLHYAVLKNDNEMANLLIQNGANPKIKNNDETYIASATDANCKTDQSEQAEQADLFKQSTQLEQAELSNKSDTSDIFIHNENMNDLNDMNKLNKLVETYTKSDSDTFKFNYLTERSDRLDRLNRLDQLSTSASKNILKARLSQLDSEEDIDTADIAQDILKNLNAYSKNKNQTKTQTQTDTDEDDKDDKISTPIELTMEPRSPLPPYKFMLEEEDDKDKKKETYYEKNIQTDSMFENIVRPSRIIPFNQSKKSTILSQLGGGKYIKVNNKTKGKRKIQTYSEMSIEEPLDIKSENVDELISSYVTTSTEIANELLDKKKSKLNSEEKSEKDSELDSNLSDIRSGLDSELSELARNISRQSTDIHERTIKKIADLLKLNLEDPESNKKARYYKAAIWKMIKEKHPELSNFDRSVEMEKNITKKVLDSIDIDKVTNEIDSYLSEKTTTTTPSESEVKSKKNKTITTSNSESDSESEIKPKTKKSSTKEPKTKKSSTKEPKTKKSSSKKSDMSEGTLSISTESDTIFSNTSDN